MIHPTNPEAVRAKREGGKGWHWVYPFDPARHERYGDAPADDRPDHVHEPADCEIAALEQPKPKATRARKAKP